MKKLIFLISLIGLSLLFNACSVGYVHEEPRYREGPRPHRPSDTHIWIEGNWYWHNQTRSYHHRDGYWVRPHQGHTYESGHWKKTGRGYRWVPGRWRR
jgi:hypothetical protein